MRCLSQCCRTSAQSPELGYKIPRDLGTCRASTSYRIQRHRRCRPLKLTFNRKGAISENQHWTLSKCNVCLSTGVCPNLQCLNHNDLLKDKKAPTNDSPGSARQIDTGVTPQHNPFRLTPDRGGGLSEGYIPTEPRDTYMGHPPPCQLSTSDLAKF